MSLNLSGKIAVIVWAAASFGMLGCVTASAAGPVIGIDAAGWSDEEWNRIAMTNDETVSTGVVIRSEASKDSSAAGYLYRGAAAEVVFRGEKWTEIRSGSVQGFVKNRYLVYGKDARAYAEQYGSAGISANWDDVNVFAQADADADITRTLTAGSTMPLLSDNGHWLTVGSAAEGTQYVSSEDVTKLLLLETAVPVEDPGSPEPAAEAVYTEAAGQEAEAVYAQEAEAAYAEPVYTETSEEGGFSEAESCTESTQQAEAVYTEPEVYTEAAPASEVSGYAAAKVSEDSEVQALYEYYIELQEAAMHPENEEDAQAKADAAVEAYQAYLDAANRMQSWVSEADGGSSEEVSFSSGAEESSSSDSEESYEFSLEDEEAEKEQKSSTPDPDNDYTNYSDLDLLAAIIWCEAGNQPYDGMVAVGSVVMNRVASSSFPNTIAEVLNQPGQFYPASSGTLQKAINAGVNETCYSAARDAMNGAQPVPGALYFNTSSGTTKLGDHYFS